MSTLSGGTTNNFTGSYELTSRTGTKITFYTGPKYVAKDIEFTVTAKSASPAFKGGAISGSAAATYTNCSTTSIDTSGVKIVTSATASRAAVLYNGAVNGWVTKADNTTASAAVTKNLDSKTTYITGVTINTNKNFDITVPNGSTTPTLTFNFYVDPDGNVVVS